MCHFLWQKGSYLYSSSLMTKARENRIYFRKIPGEAFKSSCRSQNKTTRFVIVYFYKVRDSIKRRAVIARDNYKKKK